MLKVRQCMIGETAWFRKLEGEYHYMGESHGAGDLVRLVFEEDGAPVALMTWAAACYRAAGWEEVGKTKGFSRVNHARDFYIPNGRPKVLFMKPFRRDAWDLVVSNDLPDEYDVAAHSKSDGVLPFSTGQVESLHWELARHLAADGKFVDEVVGLVSVVDAESGDAGKSA